MNSMTGFGRGESATDGWRCVVEISSLNRKQSDIEVRLPREWQALESDVRKIVGTNVSRGRVNVQVAIELPAGSSAALKVDYGLAKAYATELNGLNAVHFPCGILNAECLLRAPGVFTLAESTQLPIETVRPQVTVAVQVALTQWNEAKAREGAHLQADIESRLATLRSLLQGIAAEAPNVAMYHREAMGKRLAEAGLALPIDDDRLLKEIAFFADRCDIAEEISRLEGHLVEFSRLLHGADVSGRAMDFLTQEMHRELNTMASKASNATIAHLVVSGKTEVERIREQVQNAE